MVIVFIGIAFVVAVFWILLSGSGGNERNFDKEKLWEMSNDKFNELYWKFCDELHKVIKDDLQKRALENAILTHNGQEPKYSIEELNKIGSN